MSTKFLLSFSVSAHAANTDIAESAKSVLLNVGGRKYEVLRKNLTNFPGRVFQTFKLFRTNLFYVNYTDFFEVQPQVIYISHYGAWNVYLSRA